MKPKTEKEKIKVGEKLVEVLMLRKDSSSPGRYLTDWGNKTPLGIYETVDRIMKGGL